MSVTNSWIAKNFSDARVYENSWSSRKLETPFWARDAERNGGKYCFEVRTDDHNRDTRAAFTNVKGLDPGKFLTNPNAGSNTAYYAGIKTNSVGKGVNVYDLFLSHVLLETNYPDFNSYNTTNYDAMTLDSTRALYAEYLTIRAQGGDAAIDNKANYTQLVNCDIRGPVHRTLRFWGRGPHYIVNTRLENLKPDGSSNGNALIWAYNGDTVDIRVWNSTFDGSPTLSPRRIKADRGGTPKITYLDKNPLLTGALHPMFSPENTPEPVDPTVPDTPATIGATISRKYWAIDMQTASFMHQDRVR